MVRDLKHSGRRAFLRGLGGGALCLPFLEFTHGHLWAAETPATLRFLTVFSHGGTISPQHKSGRHSGTGSHHGEDWWRPSDPASESLVLGPIHQPLEPWREKLIVLAGIDNRSAIDADQYGRGGHGIANVTALTAADVLGGKDSAESAGPSIDHVVADRLAGRQAATFKRIHLKVSGHQYGSPYYRAASERVGGEGSPQAAFAAIFEGVDTGTPDPELEQRRLVRTSVLNGLQEGYSRFRNVVSQRDRQVIDAHLDHLHALEQQLQNPVACTPPEANSVGSGADGDVVGRLHAEIIVAAIRCGLTNVANLELADILTPWTPTGTPMNSAHGIGHSLGHSAREVGPTGAESHLLDAWLAEMLDNRRWRMGLLAQILEGLDDPNFMEGDRTILDNSLALYTSEFSDPAGHISKNVPVLLAGSAGGYLQTGRYIDYNARAQNDPLTRDYETSESLHNLFTSILHAMGETDDHFGNDTAAHQGPLPGLV